MITKIANEIINETILLNWKFYGLLILITFVTTCISSYIFPYIAARAKFLATKADFNLLLAQVETTTEVTESIKTAISHSDWVLKEFKLLKRSKLEELLITLYDIEEWIKDEANNVLFMEGNKKSVSPIKKLNLIGILYFTELKTEISNFDKCYREAEIFILSEGQKLNAFDFDKKKIQLEIDFAMEHKPEILDDLLLKSKVINEQLKVVIKEASEKYVEMYKVKLEAVSAIENKASMLMQDYIKVELDEKVKLNA